MKQVRQIFSQRIPSWFYKVVLFPFIATRAILVLVAWFAGSYFPNLGFETYVARGFVLSPHFLLDIWTRWDSQLYLSIVEEGYSVKSLEEMSSTFSNLAFFPLYPYLVKLCSYLIPAAFHSRSVYLAIGVALSNLFFLAALVLLYRLVRDLLFDEETAIRTVVLLLAYPASFFFSTFYPESLFLFLSLAVFHVAQRRQWWAAGLLAALLALTRPQGILIVLPLLWMYLEARRFQLSALRVNILALLLAPLGLAAHFYHLYRLTGVPLAPVAAQGGWGRSFSNPLSAFLDLFIMPQEEIVRVETVLLIAFIFLSILVLVRLRQPAYGMYACLLLALMISSSLYVSVSRHLALIFPAFIMLASLLKRPLPYEFTKALFFALQVAFMIGWANYYWIA